VRLDLVVGPNGAGKTTFAHVVLARSLPPDAVFVNADEIAAQRWPDDPEGNSYEASRVAAQTRNALIAAHRMFVAETVFSHPSKLDLITDAHKAGYTVALHVLLVPEELTVRRVAYRVAAGGHSVPAEKVRERYRRLWTLVSEAMRVCDTATVYDNSAHSGPTTVAQLTGGAPVGAIRWPPWAPEALTKSWPATDAD
jgi:predicted ABC-type ATPase